MGQINNVRDLEGYLYKQYQIKLLTVDHDIWGAYHISKPLGHGEPIFEILAENSRYEYDPETSRISIDSWITDDEDDYIEINLPQDSEKLILLLNKILSNGKL